MKNRKKQQKKIQIKRSESLIDQHGSRTTLPAPPVRQKSASILHNSRFWQDHNLTFRKIYNNSGDSDSYFKNTLRNYSPHFDTKSVEDYFKASYSSPYSSYRSPAETFRSTRSQRNFSSHKKPANYPRTPREKSKFTLRSPGLHLIKTVPDEEDVDVFYSPDSVSDNQEETNQVTTTKMAEEEEMAEDVAGGEEEAPVEIEVEETVPAEAEEGEEGEDDQMKEVQDIIKQASDELLQAAEQQNKMETEESGEPGKEGSIFKYDPNIDSAVLKELEEAELQAKETAKIITDLKQRVTELLKKEKCTEAEAKELEEKNTELKAQMLLFEKKTARIQFLIAQTNLFDNMMMPKGVVQTKHKEDSLPKVIVCGATGCDNMPKLILCDTKPKSVCRAKKCPSIGKGDEAPADVVPKIAKRLSDSYCMQEKLAAENADLEGTRYKLQSDLLNKDQTIEFLQRKLCTIQCEMRMICQENSALNEKIQQVVADKQQGFAEAQPSKRPICGKKKGDCPSNFEDRLTEYSETTKLLETHLASMENDVKAMHSELQSVQAEREHLEQHRNIVICPPLCLPPPPCNHPMPPCGHPSPPCGLSPCRATCPPGSPISPIICPPPCDQPLRELKEQYARLQDDFKSKVTEVAGLRTENEKLKTAAREAEEIKKQLEEKIKECDKMMKVMNQQKNQFLGSKEQLIEQEQQLIVAKQRFREAQDELEELRLFIQDQQGQMDDYRNKYLESEQKCEEQRRHIDMLEMDATRVNEQVNLEIQRIKGQFQEKLHELMPLPDLLKSTQIKLNETQQMHLLAERNNEALEKELAIYKDKVACINSQMELAKSDLMCGEDDKVSLGTRIEQLEAELKELREQNDALLEEMSKAEELIDSKEMDLQARLHEIAQLEAQLENVREESARQVARNKERCETVRRSMQNQISDLERQLVQSRAQAKAAQKDRDEIRQKMQQQISNLHENFEDAQMRIRNLQGHVNFLKVSYPAPIGACDTESLVSDDICNCP